eukprot:TRINITY_DN3160_c3_g3_i2.p1 TRINITY_DN3160_c3_g3~~TRINITY_DN3160_c3_g3_i2.p1  ORF type:complete len:704 (-),score=159.82 TRINITY_DN3160_c3_g3_i2:244-2355(-)
MARRNGIERKTRQRVSRFAVLTKYSIFTPFIVVLTIRNIVSIVNYTQLGGEILASVRVEDNLLKFSLIYFIISSFLFNVISYILFLVLRNQTYAYNSYRFDELKTELLTYLIGRIRVNDWNPGHQMFEKKFLLNENMLYNRIQMFSNDCNLRVELEYFKKLLVQIPNDTPVEDMKSLLKDIKRYHKKISNSMVFGQKILNFMKYVHRLSFFTFFAFDLIALFTLILGGNIKVIGYLVLLIFITLVYQSIAIFHYFTRTVEIQEPTLSPIYSTFYPSEEQLKLLPALGKANGLCGVYYFNNLLPELMVYNFIQRKRVLEWILTIVGGVFFVVSLLPLIFNLILFEDVFAILGVGLIFVGAFAFIISGFSLFITEIHHIYFISGLLSLLCNVGGCVLLILKKLPSSIKPEPSGLYTIYIYLIILFTLAQILSITFSFFVSKKFLFVKLNFSRRVAEMRLTAEIASLDKENQTLKVYPGYRLKKHMDDRLNQFSKYEELNEFIDKDLMEKETEQEVNYLQPFLAGIYDGILKSQQNAQQSTVKHITSLFDKVDSSSSESASGINIKKKPIILPNGKLVYDDVNQYVAKNLTVLHRYQGQKEDEHGIMRSQQQIDYFSVPLLSLLQNNSVSVDEIDVDVRLKISDASLCGLPDGSQVYAVGIDFDNDLQSTGKDNRTTNIKMKFKCQDPTEAVARLENSFFKSLKTE